MSALTIDTHEFTRRGDAAEARLPVARLERLASMLVSADGDLAWSLAGESRVGADGARQAFLRLGLGARLSMRCARCLEPVEVPLDIERDYRLVSSEAQAEQEDPDEDAFDLLVSSRQFDLGELIEDEAIMALPLAPTHDDCEAPAPAASTGDDAAVAEASVAAARNPFAALAALRTPGGEGEAASVDDAAGPSSGEAGDAPAGGAGAPRRRR